MPRRCSICSHEDREEINAALLAGESLRGISRKFFGSVKAEDALARHREHLPLHLVKASEAAEVIQADTLLDRLLSLNAETMAILHEARTGRIKDNELALRAIARAEKQLELQGKLLGELNDAPTVNILMAAPEWRALRSTIILALEPYPQARTAVLEALSAG
jgi:hypothetical protein